MQQTLRVTFCVEEGLLDLSAGRFLVTFRGASLLEEYRVLGVEASYYGRSPGD